MKNRSKNVQTKIKDAVYALEMRQLLLSEDLHALKLVCNAPYS